MKFFKTKTEKNIELIKRSALFNEAWYLLQNPDVQASQMDAAEHYYKYGWREGRDPSDLFSSLEYLSLNPDVRKMNICPLVHYEKCGRKEQRKYGFGQVSLQEEEYWKQRDKLPVHEKVHYSCMVGEYDKIRPYTYLDPQWDYVLFTDRPELIRLQKYLHWQVRPLVYTKADNIRNARWHKMHPHLLFPQYKYSIWEDSNHSVTDSFIYTMAQQHIEKGHFLAIPLHPQRNCVYEEAQACIELAKDEPQVIQKQIASIRSKGFPEKYGLFETFLMFRQHHQPGLKELMEDWWHQVEKFSCRDQLSFTYVLWKHHFTCYPFAARPLRAYPEYVAIFHHKRKKI